MLVDSSSRRVLTRIHRGADESLEIISTAVDIDAQREETSHTCASEGFDTRTRRETIGRPARRASRRDVFMMMYSHRT